MNESETEQLLRPLVSGWLSKLELSKRSRSKWQESADECMAFYARSADGMYNPKSKMYVKNLPSTRFKIILNKAAEVVNIYGPSLLWDIPHRTVVPKRALEIPIEVFGDPQDPQVQQFYQQTMMGAQQEGVTDKLTSHLMQTWLNYTPREQPGGGLENHSMLAVTDALIKGRGVLWVKPYQFPASGRTLTGCFREPPENLLTDPDFSVIGDCRWIAIKRVAPVWEVERRFELKKGALKDRSTLESAWAEAEFRSADEYGDRKDSGKTCDMITYYEIWSKTGPGSRLTGMSTPIKDHLEESIGDFAWMAISPSVPYPLNCPPEVLARGATDDEVRNRFAWPVPCWADDRWPIEVLDFIPDPDSSWPIPLLAQAMGELKFLNIMISHLASRIWSSSRDFWGVIQPAFDEFSSKLQAGSDQTIFSIPTTLGNKISDIATIFQQPQTNLDVWKIIDAVSEIFDKRTGLTDFVYGLNTNSTQDRSAETSMNRKQASGVRPEFMGKLVGKWQANVAALEAYCSALFIKGSDVAPLMGQTGAALWDSYIANQEPETIARQMQYTVDASSIRRPNKDRDIGNMNQALSVWLPVAAQAAQVGGNYDSVNEIMKKWGDAADMNMEGIAIQPPQPDPVAQQMQQQQMQLEMAKIQADVQSAQMDAQSKQVDMQAKQQDAQLKMQIAQMNMQAKQQEVQLKSQASMADMQMKQQSAQAGMQNEQQKLALSASVQQMKVASDQEAQANTMMFDAARAQQDLQQDQAVHEQELIQSAIEFQQKLQQEKALAAVKVAMAKKAPKPAAKPAKGKA